MYVRVRGDGAITLPVELRRKYSVNPGEYYQISVSGKGKISLTPKRSVCSLCGAEVLSVNSVTGMCPYCNHILSDMVKRGWDLGQAIKHLQKERRKGSI